MKMYQEVSRVSKIAEGINIVKRYLEVSIVLKCIEKSIVESAKS